MALPRSKYVNDGQIGVYHCVSRCVRRAFLCGYDVRTGQDYSHRKKWVVDRLRFLASIFAIDVCAYAIMENHPHSVLRTRPDIVATWLDQEVATRWLTLCPQKQRLKGKLIPPLKEQIQTLTACPERITVLRKRLSSLSWFMGRLNEFIARAANKEDKVKGRFWEGRFKCQALLDEAAIAACMAYVDLNPIRAGVAATPEESNFTSIQERIRNWQMDTSIADSVPNKTAQVIQSTCEDLQKRGENINPSPLNPQNDSVAIISLYAANLTNCWLCPIQSDSNRRGILPMTTTEYFDLVDKSGRIIRPGIRGTIDANLGPILRRIGAIPESWSEIVSHFGSRFWLASGQLSNLRIFADLLGQKWFKGIATARLAFASSTPHTSH
jgi:hypothetical protein